ncbi:MAG TPA: protein kinase, partial [Puia sp.]|nr:protein kinase [Puia sp.]
KTAGVTPPQYRAPELWKNPSRGQEALTATDIWAFGASIYEMITGDMPFGDLGGRMQMSDPYMRPLPAPWPEELNGILVRCLDREPGARPTAAMLEKWAGRWVETGKWKMDEMGTVMPWPAGAGGAAGADGSGGAAGVGGGVVGGATVRGAAGADARGADAGGANISGTDAGGSDAGGSGVGGSGKRKSVFRVVAMAAVVGVVAVLVYLYVGWTSKPKPPMGSSFGGGDSVRTAARVPAANKRDSADSVRRSAADNVRRSSLDSAARAKKGPDKPGVAHQGKKDKGPAGPRLDSVKQW